MTNEISINELENVSGGTVAEFKELLYTMAADPSLGNELNLKSHMPAVNRYFASELEDLLQEKYGIFSYISVGLLGTGLGSDPNYYMDIETHETISHNEVLRRIRRS